MLQSKIWFMNSIVGEPFLNGSSSHLDCYHVSYRQVPTFDHDTIQCFHSNCSKKKKMAARDFEDLLLVW